MRKFLAEEGLISVGCMEPLKCTSHQFDPQFGRMTLTGKKLVDVLPKVLGFLWLLEFPTTGVFYDLTTF